VPPRRAAVIGVVGALAGIAAMLWLARGVVDTDAYLQRAGTGTLIFAGLFGLALRFEGPTRRTFDALVRAPVAVWAALVVAACVSAEAWVFDGVPHTSDEAAYQFQARALSTGRLGFPPPPELAFFDFIHLTDAGGLWHGTMNPGWPALMAPAMRLGVPQLTNPILAGATLLLMYGALRRSALGELAARLTACGLALSPFFVFLGATTMAHTSNLFLFALFLYAFARLQETERPSWAALAGLALAIGATVRPLDTAVAAAPFGLWMAVRAARDPSARTSLLFTGGVAALGVATLLAYNAALTGSPLVFPQEIHFERLVPGQRFGFGFGPDMGTSSHGPEWPGYFPSDAPRVTSHRLLVWLEDLYGLPLILLAALIAFARPRSGGAWPMALFASAASVVLVYLGHFYHGIAYGSRHYAMALPGVVALLALAAARAIDKGDTRARLARAACVSTAAYSLLFATPPLVREYSSNYRSASGAIREAVERRSLDAALVFVHPQHWGWKSAFPLNDYPLERNAVLFAKDRGHENERLRRLFPDRTPYRIRIGTDGRAYLSPFPAPR